MATKNENPFADWPKLTSFQKLNCINNVLLAIPVGAGLAAEYMILMAKIMDTVIRLEGPNVLKRHD